MVRSRVFPFAVLVSTLVCVLPAHAAISTTAQSGIITVTGATPSGKVLIYGEMSQEDNAGLQFTEVTADANGQASVPMRLFPSNPVWVAADVTTGTYVTTPGRRPSTRGTVSYSSDGTTISMNRGGMDFCIFRPGVGAWETYQIDGLAGDLDPRVQYVTFSISKFQPVSNEPPVPLNLRKGDVIFAFDLEFFPEYYILPVLTDAVIPTATAVSSVPNPSLPGSPLTFIASVTPAASSPAPTGVITLFVDGSAAVSAPLADSRAAITIEPLPIGSHLVFAQYAPTAGSIFRESLSSVLTQVVEPSRRRSAHH